MKAAIIADRITSDVYFVRWPLISMTPLDRCLPSALTGKFSWKNSMWRTNSDKLIYVSFNYGRRERTIHRIIGLCWEVNLHCYQSCETPMISRLINHDNRLSVSRVFPRIKQ